jgi:hypothetical protein
VKKKEGRDNDSTEEGHRLPVKMHLVARGRKPFPLIPAKKTSHFMHGWTQDTHSRVRTESLASVLAAASGSGLGMMGVVTPG